MKIRPSCVAAALVCLTLSLVAQTTNSTTTPATATVPRLITFSGTLSHAATEAGENGIALTPGAAPTQVVAITFSLYAEETGGAQLWSEMQNVHVDGGGRYMAQLGATTADGLPMEIFSSAQAQWLGVQRQGQAEQPRVMVVSVPYALKAADAETFGGLPPSAYALAPPSEPNLPPGNGSSGLGNGGTGHDAPHSLPITGSGTTNYVPLWTNASTLASSTIYQSGSFLGIGTTTPTQPLEVFSNSSTGLAVIEGFSTATTGSVAGVEGKTASSSGNGVYGIATSNSGSTNGVYGESDSNGNDATGVYGIATSNSGTTYGVQGMIASSSGGAGVVGIASSTTGAVWGVQGGTASSSGDGVHGVAISTNGNTHGVYGRSQSSSGIGVSGIASSATGITNGVYGESQSSSGVGVSGIASSATGITNGVYGESDSNGNDATGVFGIATSTTGTTYGVEGTIAGSSGAGVLGIASSTTGAVFGVQGGTDSSSGDGVHGVAISTSGNTNGVYGKSLSSSGNGVFGIATSTTGTTYGVQGQSPSNSGTGVYGNATATTGSTNGVVGQSASPTGTGVYGINTATSGSGYGVYGSSVTGPGVQGFSTNNAGVVGACGPSSSSPCTGVYAISNSTTGTTNGLVAMTNSAAGAAGYFINNAGGLILLGVTSNGGNARFYVDGGGNGYFAGNLQVAGTLTKGGGSFKIDDPIDPANKYLSHSFVESPDMMNIYNGNVTTDKRGLATVVLPDYFEALNRDFRYQLTVIGQFAQAIVAKEIDRGRFTIRTNKPAVKVSWQVTGIRQDAWANAHRIPTEEDKPAAERGHNLHPELFGAPQSQGIHNAAVHHPADVSPTADAHGGN